MQVNGIVAITRTMSEFEMLYEFLLEQYAQTATKVHTYPYWPFGFGEMRKRSYAKPLPRAVIFLQNRFRSQKRCSCHLPRGGRWPV